MMVITTSISIRVMPARPRRPLLRFRWNMVTPPHR
jgi:hypothetical protein